MFLSDDQMRAAGWGLGHDTPVFAWVDLPVGPQPLPTWIKDLHIDWMDGWDNRPQIILKTATDARDWTGKTFREKQARYIAESGDGRAEQYAHDGKLTWNADRNSWLTTQQEGLGGSNIPIVMDDGRHVILRGPWHCGAPAGFVETAYVNISNPYYLRSIEYGRRHRNYRRPWFQNTATAGLYITEDLLIRAVARFAPTCLVARITDQYGSHLEPVRADWDVPKSFLRRAA